MSHPRPTPPVVLAALLVLAGALALPSCKPVSAPAPRTSPPAQPALMSWRVANAHLEDIFETIPNSSIDAFRQDIPEEERAQVNASHGEAGIKEGNAYVYGEPSPAASDRILRRLALGPDDVLYDLGCGRGFFLMQALLTTPVGKAVGVELAASRVAVGQLARQKLLERGLLAPGKELSLHGQDMAQTNLDEATVVFMDSVFFSDQLLNAVARHMAQAGRLRAVVMIMKGLPPNPWFELEGTERLKMSWSPKYGSDVLFYRRTAAPPEGP
jgi:SAM-dependent methyltransferase